MMLREKVLAGLPEGVLARPKEYLKAGLRTLGIEMRRASEAPPPPPLLQDPLEVVSRRNSHDFVALECPLSECVVYNGFTTARSGWHPFVQAASDYIERGIDDYERSLLPRYYQAWQPKNALDAMIGLASGPASLMELPSYVFHVPWSDKTPREQAAFMARIIEIENSSFGAPTLTSADGYCLHGPVSASKGRLELKRLLRVVESIRRHGYDRSKGDVTVHVLHRNGQFRYMIIHGQHRAAALAALGHERLPAIPINLVDADHVEHWPGVYRGFWTASDALTFFDHLFRFDSRAWADEKRIFGRANGSRASVARSST